MTLFQLTCGIVFRLYHQNKAKFLVQDAEMYCKIQLESQNSYQPASSAYNRLFYSTITTNSLCLGQHLFLPVAFCWKTHHQNTKIHHKWRHHIPCSLRYYYHTRNDGLYHAHVLKMFKQTLLNMFLPSKSTTKGLFERS